MADVTEPGDDKIPGPFGVRFDDKDDTLNVTLVIQGVKKPSWFGLKKNTFVEATFKERSLRIFVELIKGKKKPDGSFEKYLYVVRQLPEVIDPIRSYYSVKQNQVILTLYKASPGSWSHILDTLGLETADRSDQ